MSGWYWLPISIYILCIIVAVVFGVVVTVKLRGWERR